NNRTEAVSLGFYLFLGAFIAFLFDLHDRTRVRAESNARAARAAADEARHERERLRVTLSSIGDAVIATDDQGRVTFMNAVAEGLVGCTPAQAVGRTLTEIFPIFHEVTGASAENPVARVLREGKVVGLANHTVLVSADGRRIPIEDSAAPIRDPDGRIFG